MRAFLVVNCQSALVWLAAPSAWSPAATETCPAGAVTVVADITGHRPDAADGADGTLESPAYPDDPASGSAFTTEANVDAQYPKECLPTTKVGLPARGDFWAIPLPCLEIPLQSVQAAKKSAALPVDELRSAIISRTRVGPSIGRVGARVNSRRPWCAVGGAGTWTIAHACSPTGAVLSAPRAPCAPSSVSLAIRRK
jgi:hypothetical protein